MNVSISETSLITAKLQRENISIDICRGEEQTCTLYNKYSENIWKIYSAFILYGSKSIEMTKQLSESIYTIYIYR